VELSQSWKRNLPLKFFIFSQAQALLDVMLSLPFPLAALDPRPALAWTDYSAAAIWAVAFAGEATADAQLSAFKSNSANKGKTCRAGLWTYSRHPNYFFEWLIWLAYALYAVSARLEANRESLLPILAGTYGERAERLWWVRWRIFFMACAELWGYHGGSEWMVCHHLFAPHGAALPEG
jgi:steroid 5-alpha reductase family enzyme